MGASLEELTISMGSDKVPRSMHNYVSLLMQHQKRAVYPELIEKPSGTRVVVLSPHPDDDVISCGGTLRKHHLAGDHITSIYLTDGRKGDPDFRNEEELIHERQREAREAAAIIGINELVFLANRDLELRTTHHTVGDLRMLLEDVRPDLVYLPFFMDNHPDHWEANRLFLLAARSLSWRVVCWAYEGWTPLFPNRIVNITDQIECKIQAIACYRTQIKHIDYIRLAKGLNAYRTLTAPREWQYAEAYLAAEVREYLKLMTRTMGSFRCWDQMSSYVHFFTNVSRL